MKKTDDIIQEYGIDFVARFACLYEGVNVACSRAERIGYDSEKSTSWIKPTAFQKYIDERYFDFKLIIQPALSSENSNLGSSEIVIYKVFGSLLNSATLIIIL